MSPEPEPGVIGSLPRTRPHRRSAKRAGSPAGAPPVDSQSAAEPEAVTAPAKPRRTAAKPTRTAAKPTRTAASPKPSASKAPPPAPVAADPSHGVLETAVQAAAELAEIGLHASARALRGAVSRLPRP